MRFVSILGAGLLLLGTTSLAGAQGFEKKKQKPAPNTQLQEIGGKSLEQWIKEISSPDRSKGENAIRTVVAFGPDRAYEAVPAIIKELKKQRGSILIDVSIRVNAVIALGDILNIDGAETHNKDLINDAVHELILMLSDSQSIVNYRAAEALGKIGPRAKTAIPLLIKLSRDRHTWETRQAAAMALGFIAIDRSGKAGPPETVLKSLYTGLSDACFQVRLASIKSLTFLGGPANQKQKDALVAAILPKATSEKEDSTVRIWAHMAIMSITHQITAEHVHGISDQLKSTELSARVQAAQALGICGDKAKSAIPRLIQGLNDKEDVVVINCIVALAAMKASAAISRLQIISNDMTRPEVIRKAATHAIDIITGKYKPPVTLEK